jgi:hypothetical protein
VQFKVNNLEIRENKFKECLTVNIDNKAGLVKRAFSRMKTLTATGESKI